MLRNAVAETESLGLCYLLGFRGPSLSGLGCAAASVDIYPPPRLSSSPHLRIPWLILRGLPSWLWVSTLALMSFFRRRTFPEDIDTDDELNDAVDPELRLRTVRTAASTLAESIRTEQRVERRKSMRKKGSRFFRRGTEKRRTDTAESGTPAAAAQIPGARRNIYVNYTLPLDEVDHNGDPIVRYVRNKVRTSSECRAASLSSLS